MMQQLDKWNKELDRLSKKRYKQMDNQLYNAYKDGLKQLKIEIKQYIDAYDSLSFSQRLQVERQLQVATQINDVINEMGGKEDRLLRSFISDEGTQGYFGTFYALEGAENIQLNFAMLPEDYIEELVNTPVAGKRLSTRLYTNQSKLAQETTTALLQGAFRGEGYAKVAKRVGELTEANYKQALRIARTEGGRVQSASKQKAYVEAKNKGIDIQKRWLSTLDKKTRHSHQQLDGQTVDVEEQFEYKGLHADAPRLFGVAAQDINCRCTTITVVNGIAPDVRRDGETGEVIDYKTYDEWAGKRIDKQVEAPTPIVKPFNASDYKNIDSLESFREIASDVSMLTKEEQEQMYDRKNGYITSANSFKINQYLRNGHVEFLGKTRDLSDEGKKTISLIDKVIESNKLSDNVVAYRKVDSKWLESLASPDETIDDFVARAKQGGISYSDKGYTSTGMVQDVTKFGDRNINLEIYADKGSNAFITDNVAESEMILPKNSTFDIIDVVENDQEGFDFKVIVRGAGNE
ncbi:phage minor head protein [Aerococcus viridans]|uniref:phage minor head protein n=1 Tax=Aerococcus viridans TaxID=1377 RepID=UPI003AA7B547